MIYYSFKYCVLLLFACLLSWDTLAQEEGLEAVKNEIREMEEREQKAFKEGDCACVVSFMDEDISFHANGRTAPERAMIEDFCNKVPRPFNRPGENRMEVFALTPTSGYVVRTLEYDNSEKSKIREVVTKIWNKRGEEWKLVHLHSTVKELPR